MVHNEDPDMSGVVPGFHGINCPHNGLDDNQDCHCDECDYYLVCYPDWKDEDFYERNASRG